ncbi:MAG: hypothetical protein ACTSXW_05155 [Candidatus Baldrarchaeia archaeon]
MRVINLFYHWFEEPGCVNIFLKKTFQQSLIKLALAKERSVGGSTRSLAAKLGVNVRTIFRWQSYESKGMLIKHLIKVCDYLNLLYTDLEKQHWIESIGNPNMNKEKMIVHPKFPFELSNKKVAEIIGYAMSDGHISSRDYHFSYGSQDINQIKRIIFLINEVCGNVKCRIIRKKNNFIYVVFPPTIGRMLKKAGAPIGNKSCLNPSLPHWIKYVGPKE